MIITPKPEKKYNKKKQVDETEKYYENINHIAIKEVTRKEKQKQQQEKQVGKAQKQLDKQSLLERIKNTVKEW